MSASSQYQGIEIALLGDEYDDHMENICEERGITKILLLLLLQLSRSVVSDSVQPHRQQPTRVPCPWDSPGKNTGVGCHFLLQCMKVKSESEVAQSCLILCNHMDCSLPSILLPWDFPGKSSGVGCHCLLCHQDVRRVILEWC